MKKGLNIVECRYKKIKTNYIKKSKNIMKELKSYLILKRDKTIVQKTDDSNILKRRKRIIINLFLNHFINWN